jgi:hypothetical protein
LRVRKNRSKLPDKGGRRSDDAASYVFCKTTELFTHRLADRFQRLKPRAALGDVNAQAFRRGVIHHGEDGHTAFGQGEAHRGVDAPHLVGPLG